MHSLATEYPIAGEDEAVQRLISLLKRRLEREYPPPARTLRDAHPKQHGLVRAMFNVEEILPPELCHGVFEQGRSYPAWLRYSNMSDPPAADLVADSRGMAIKLMGVEGEKLLADNFDAKAQDFVLMSSDFFVTKDIVGFSKFLEAIEGGILHLLYHFATHPRLFVQFRKVQQRFASPFEIRYGSTTPYRLGPNAVKYAVRPVSPTNSVIPKNPSDDFLREAMVQRLSQCDVRLDFMIQLQTDAIRMPIEDAQVIWSEKLSNYQKVATIVIPKQSFDTSAQHEYGDNLSFNPWHCLPEHRPLGSLNRGRKVIYAEMANFRRERNQVQCIEPAERVTS